MANVTFFEKPGCRNNTKQKALLAAAGHQVDAYSLLTHPWTVGTLRPFFGDRPVAEWFNKAAPKVKDGLINPAAFNEDQALAMMIEEPLLIRRPLMEVNGEKRCGFDLDSVDAWIGLQAVEPAGDLETCPSMAATASHDKSCDHAVPCQGHHE